MLQLDQHIVSFARALREAGMNVSPAAALTAVSTLAVIDATQRSEFKVALSASLLDSGLHEPLFDSMFEIWFPRRSGGTTAPYDTDEYTTDGPTQARTKASGAVALNVCGNQEPDTAERDGLRNATIDTMVAGRDSDRLGRQILSALGKTVTTSGGAYSSHQALQRLNPTTLIAAIAEGLSSSSDQTSIEYKLARRVARRRVTEFNQQIQHLSPIMNIEVMGRDAVQSNPAFTVAERSDFSSLALHDEEALRKVVQSLSTLIAGEMRRVRPSRTGFINMRRTVRSAMSTAGVLIKPAMQRRRATKPRLVVLCDLSQSVAPFSAFTLLFLQTLRSDLTSTRVVFGFVDSVDEITALLPRTRTTTVPALVNIVNKALQSTRLARYGGSDYGTAFYEFVQKYGNLLTPKTTLLIVGDARTNHKDPAVTTLTKIANQVHKAVWLNPEPSTSWGSGDSAAVDYQKVLPMHECRNASQLATAIRSVLL